MTITNRNYRKAFTLAIIVNLLLLGTVAGLWWRFRERRPEASPTTTAASGQNESKTAAASANTPAAETPLAPVQFTPQRMQSIGVKLGTAQLKQVEAELR